ncbi:uncharacterized protein [Palaemon carinicauda]|uniref:uncharacterized protein n=1 Tax=Palaemon carinicauda TaxID=392227 RepID=UPI0035B61FD3
MKKTEESIMSKSLSPEPPDFEFVDSDDCNPEIEDDWYLVDIDIEEFPPHGPQCSSPLDSCKTKEEDNFILSYVSVLRGSEEAEIQNERSVGTNPLNPIKEDVGLTKGIDNTRSASWNPTSFKFIQDDASIDWDECAFHEISLADVTPKLDKHVDVYIMDHYKKARKCDLFSGRFSKRIRKQQRPDWI